MRQALFLALIMALMPLSVVSISFDKSGYEQILTEQNEPANVIAGLANLNIPGHQEGSIYTNTTISSGGGHTCAILDNGSVSCWGHGEYGQLGNGGTANQNSPTLTSSLGLGRTAVAISSGKEHTCAILDNGSVSCWGRGLYGRLGNGGTMDQTTPTLTNSLGPGRTAEAISSGSFHTCAILDNGSVSCWGLGGYGMMGNGGTAGQQHSPMLTSSLGPGRTAVAISSGKEHTCAILDNGSVSCWGRGFNGVLGDGGTTDHTTPTPISSLGPGRTAVALSSGLNHICAILDNGSVSCWGFGYYGQLGSGGTSNLYSPTQTHTLGFNRTAVAISSGGYHTCVVLDNGSVSCWGRGLELQLGYGGTNGKTTPTLTTSLGAGRIAVALASGEEHSCALLRNASVKCWGKGSFGRMGSGGTTDQPTPTLTSSLGNGRTVGLSERDLDSDGILNIFDAVPYTSSATSSPVWNVPGFQEGSIFSNTTLSSGGLHSCAILDNGSVKCWGRGNRGQMGNNLSTENNPTPILTNNLGAGRTAVSISSGGEHTCAILDNGSVICWGNGATNQMGTGEGGMTKYPPTLTSSLGDGRTAVALSAGRDHTCAILDNGSIVCWGADGDGQLGDGIRTNLGTPTQTTGLGAGRTAIAISAGEGHTCAILDNGSVLCWGRNGEGQLGNGAATVDQVSPILTSSLGPGRTAVALGLGKEHTCALLDNGHVSCWGQGRNGQIGDGTTTTTYTPKTISNFGSGNPALAVAISSGDEHTCVILETGSVSCWGWNSHGQAGGSGSSPGLINFSGGRKAIGLSLGKVNSCFVLDDGTIPCWGTNSHGERGNSGYFGSNRTVAVSERDLDGDGVLNIFDSNPYSHENIILTNWSISPTNGPYSGGTHLNISGDFSEIYDALNSEIRVNFLGYGNVTATLINNSTISVISPTGPTEGGYVTVTVWFGGHGFELSTPFMYLPNAPKDDDFDGVPDEVDDCPREFGNSTMDRRGCPDTDADGYSDLNDMFPTDPNEWSDTDNDGVGDNSDAFPNEANETVDSDNDGVGDNADAFPFDANETVDSDGDGLGDNSDAFPNDANETMDSDGDGVGDNADEYPLIHNFNDSDEDGYPDVIDDFIDDPTQWSDADGDGFGDSSEGNNPDAFINNATQWYDTDGDGYGDNWGNEAWNSTRLFIWPGQFVVGAELADHCPTESGNSTADGYFGCPDRDGDGIADMYDDEHNSGDTTNGTNETSVVDTDADGVEDLFDLCPNTMAGGYVDIDGCLLDDDGDGVDDLTDACPRTPPGAQINIYGCTVEEDVEQSFMESLRAGEQEAVLTTVGLGAVLIAFLGFLQTNMFAALLPDSLRWIRVFRTGVKLNKEEVLELEYLKSLVQTYHLDTETLHEELYQLKSELSARYTNSEIKKLTKEKISTLINDLLTMDVNEVRRVAHNDAFFGLVGTLSTQQRTNYLTQEALMRGDDEPANLPHIEEVTLSNEVTHPPAEWKGEMNENDGYEYLEHPSGSGTWYYRQRSSDSWKEWT